MQSSIMEVEEMGPLIQKLHHIHNTILTISTSIPISNNFQIHPDPHSGEDAGFVYDNGGFPVENGGGLVVADVGSLSDVREALEDLQEHLQFFHTMQLQQRVERDVAIARLEQSQVMLALRLAEHHGEMNNVIEEAQALLGEVRNYGKFPKNGHGSAECPSGKKCLFHLQKWSKFFKVLISSLNFTKKPLKLDHLGGIVGKAALVAVTMFALVHTKKVADRGRFTLDVLHRQGVIYNGHVQKVSQPEVSLSRIGSSRLDVLLARG